MWIRSGLIRSSLSSDGSSDTRSTFPPSIHYTDEAYTRGRLCSKSMVVLQYLFSLWGYGLLARSIANTPVGFHSEVCRQ